MFPSPDQVRRPCEYDAPSSDDEPRKHESTSARRRAKYKELFDDGENTGRSQQRNSSNLSRTYNFLVCLLSLCVILATGHSL